MRIGVLYDAWHADHESGAERPSDPLDRRKKRREKLDREEIHAALLKKGHPPRYLCLDGRARTLNALATTPVDLFVISRARFDEASRTHPLIGVKVFARLARTLALRLRHSDRELRTFYDA